MPSESSRFDVTYHNIKMPRDGIRIVPVGDIHYNAPMFAKDVFAEWCRRYKNQEHVYYIGIGDYLETLSGSERKALAVVHDSSREWLDERITDDVNALADKLAFTRGKWLGMLSGNHTHITADGMSITQMLATRLDAQPLGVCAMIRLYLADGTTKTTRAKTYDIVAHHGRGGGVLAGSTINALERWSNGFNADLFLMGHDHAKMPAQLERLTLAGERDDLRPHAETITLVRTGGFLKGYEKGKVSYIVERAARPRTLGTAEVTLKMKRDKIGRSKENMRIETQVTI